MLRTSAGAAMLAVALFSQSAGAVETAAARGQYLVTIGGCNDCHTPGYFFGQPDMGRFLGGSDVGFEIPGLGVFVGPNITPDQETGIGAWSQEQIVSTLKTGTRPDGRQLAPIMPYHALANLTDEDLDAIAAFLKSVDPVSHKVPDPVPPGGTTQSFMFRILPPGQIAAEAPK